MQASEGRQNDFRDLRVLTEDCLSTLQSASKAWLCPPGRPGYNYSTQGSAGKVTNTSREAWIYAHIYCRDFSRTVFRCLSTQKTAVRCRVISRGLKVDVITLLRPRVAASLWKLRRWLPLTRLRASWIQWSSTRPSDYRIRLSFARGTVVRQKSGQTLVILWKAWLEVFRV